MAAENVPIVPTGELGPNSENPSIRPAAAEAEESRKPKDTPFRQQRVKAWIPILTPHIVAACFAIIGVIFIPIGDMINRASNTVVEYSYTYDKGASSSSDPDYTGCEVTELDGEAKSCVIKFEVTEKMDSPVYVYYELKNFFQNHRRYVRSRSSAQLTGTQVDSDSNCDPLQEADDGQTLNPCGLIANSLFTDVFVVAGSDGAGYTGDSSSYMLETGISWKTDREDRFKQPDDFRYEQIVSSSSTCSTGDNTTANCETCLGSGKSPCNVYTDEEGNEYFYYYPDDDTTRYLYELYPDIVTPIEGVENEHFQVWMRTAGLSTFRKLYGKINYDLAAGDTISFNVTSSYYVDGFDGEKSLVIASLGRFGAKNDVLGWAYIALGALSLALALGFTIKQFTHPRKLGDTKFLRSYR